MANHEEEMKARMLSGEFGNPIDMMAVNAAWGKLLNTEVANSPKKIYHSISGLWKQGAGKVAFNGRTTEPINIPMGAKILAFHRESDNERAPDLGLVWVEE